MAALLGETQPQGGGEQREQPLSQAPIEFLRPSPKNPRRTFVDSDLEELAASIRERGIIQPIVVRPVSGSSDTYEIVAGERRWRAAQRAGLHTVPILSMQLTDREALECSIIENVQRTDLSALEEARGYAQLASDYGYNHADIGRIVGKSRSHVANTLRLLGLPEHTRELLSSGVLTAGHARALLPLPNPDAVADRVVAQGLSVRDVEKLSSNEEATKVESPGAADVDPNVRDLEQRLSQALGARVEIRGGKRSQEIRIKLKTLEQLDFITNKLFGN